MGSYNAALLSILSGRSNGTQVTIVSSQFTLSSSMRTSAAVFDSDNVKVRDLWADDVLPAGTYPVYWDGLNDLGVIQEAGSYTIKVAKNNLTYSWTARIGNTSTAQTGSTVHRMWVYSMVDAVPVGNYMYYCAGYSEGRPSVAKFALTDPQAKIDILPNQSTKDTNTICADSSKIYLAGYDPYAATNTWVNALNVSDDSYVTFSAGVDFKGVHNEMENTISYMDATDSFITGMDVMKTGIYLFVARKGLNQIQVLNKTTGALVRTLTYASAKALRIDGSDKLWISYGTNTIEKFTVNGDGTLTTTGVTITGVTDPGYIAVKGTKILIIDYSTQQIKEFNNTTGAAVGSAFGRSGGYLTNAIVYDDKFCLKTVGRGNLYSFIAFNSDNSYWFGDSGNNRILKFNSSNVLIDRVMYLPPTYSTWVNLKNINSVGGDWYEFNVNYSVALTGTTGWSLTRNWGASFVTSGSGEQNKVDDFRKFLAVRTFTFGGVTKTFGFLVLGSGQGIRPFEMKADGTFRLGTTDIPNHIFDADGNAVWYGKSNFLGFNTDGDPTWSANYDEVYINPGIVPAGVNMPSEGFRGFPLSSTGKFIIYDYAGRTESNAKNQGFHLGAIQKGTSSWLWKTALNTAENYFGPFPDANFFDTGNGVQNYAGSACVVVDRYIVTGYNGEFWKNGQTNKYNIYLDSGLPLIQLGTTSNDRPGPSESELAGNAKTIASFIEPVSGDLCIVHGDESAHAAVHMFRVSGLSTISELALSVNYPSAALTKPADAFVNLMSGLPKNTSPLTNGAGWSVNPAPIPPGGSGDTWYVYTNKAQPSLLKDADIAMELSAHNGNFTVSRDLGTVNSNWRITGQLSYQNSDLQGDMMAYLDVLDSAGKIIARLDFIYDFDNNIIRFRFNGQQFNPDNQNVYALMQSIQPVSIESNGTNVTINYMGNTLTKPKFDSTASINVAKTLRATLAGGPINPTGRNMNLKDFKLYL